MTRIYSAGFWGTEAQAEQLAQTNEMLLHNKSVTDVFIPEESNNENPYEFGTQEWQRKQFNMDVNALANSDVVVATLKDGEVDTGTVVEIGIAYTLNKPIYLVTDATKLNLMIAQAVNYNVKDAKELTDIDFSVSNVNTWNGDVE